ncbi:MAG: cyclase family protein [Ktedonobacteraceae bacterium]
MSQGTHAVSEQWIDISLGLHDGMVHWPDNPPVQIGFVKAIDKGDVCNVSKISMGVHSGTHMDAPLHFLQDGKSIDTMPLSATIGRVRVIEIQDTESIKATELEHYRIQMGERLLFKTINSTHYWQTDAFEKNFVFISQEAAEYLARLRVQTVGVDYLSVGGFFTDGPETHYALLGAGIWIIEGLNLAPVAAGEYELICLPVKLTGCEGAPARAIVKRV